MQVFLVRAQPHVFVLDMLECRQEPLLLVLGQGLVGHRKQAVVLLLDVLAEETDVTPSVCDEPGDGFALAECGTVHRLGHAPNMRPALLVLVEHHARGTTLTRKPLGLHGWEEVGFLFSVVAAVGEVAEEVQGLFGGGLVQPPLGRTVLGHFFQAIEYLLDNAMFAAEDFGWFHRRLLEKCLFVCSTESYLPSDRRALIWIKSLQNILNLHTIASQLEIST